MKTVVPIELDDNQRNTLATVLDGRITSRLATRADIKAFVEGCIDAVLTIETRQRNASPGTVKAEVIDLYHHHDDPHLLNKSPSYIRGWNQVKFRHATNR